MGGRSCKKATSRQNTTTSTGEEVAERAERGDYLEEELGGYSDGNNSPKEEMRELIDAVNPKALGLQMCAR
jgi:hypothetical protein